MHLAVVLLGGKTMLTLTQAPSTELFNFSIHGLSVADGPPSQDPLRAEPTAGVRRVGRAACWCARAAMPTDRDVSLPPVACAGKFKPETIGFTLASGVDMVPVLALLNEYESLCTTHLNM